MNTHEVLKLALEALVCLREDFDADQFEWGIADEAITAIKEALAQPEQEPVAFSCLRCATPKKCAVHGCSPNTWPSESSPKRPWAGLTDEEIEEAYAKPTLRKMYQAIEAKLKELNT